jgi:hypothetical protein
MLEEVLAVDAPNAVGVEWKAPTDVPPYAGRWGDHEIQRRPAVEGVEPGAEVEGESAGVS